MKICRKLQRKRFKLYSEYSERSQRDEIAELLLVIEERDINIKVADNTSSSVGSYSTEVLLKVPGSSLLEADFSNCSKIAGDT